MIALPTIYITLYNRRQTESNQTCLNCRGAKEEDAVNHLLNPSINLSITKPIKIDFNNDGSINFSEFLTVNMKKEKICNEDILQKSGVQVETPEFAEIPQE